MKSSASKIISVCRHYDLIGRKPKASIKQLLKLINSSSSDCKIKTQIIIFLCTQKKQSAKNFIWKIQFIRASNLKNKIIRNKFNQGGETCKI